MTVIFHLNYNARFVVVQRPRSHCLILYNARISISHTIVYIVLDVVEIIYDHLDFRR